MCRQLGRQALEHAVTQTAGLLPRDLQALAADAAAAAVARGLDALSMLPKLQSPNAADAQNLLEATVQPEAQPISLFKSPLNRQQEGANGQQKGLDGQQAGAVGQQEGPDGQQKGANGQQKGANGQQQGGDWQLAAISGQPHSFGGIAVCEADVQASLDRVRQRTATVIGAPKVSLTFTCF